MTLPEEQDPGTKETSSIAMSPVKKLPLTPSNVIYESYHESASTKSTKSIDYTGFSVLSKNMVNPSNLQRVVFRGCTT